MVPVPCMAAHDEGVAVIRKVSWLEAHVERRRHSPVLQAVIRRRPFADSSSG